MRQWCRSQKLKIKVFTVRRGVYKHCVVERFTNKA